MYITEWAAFRLKSGATVVALREASQQMQTQFLDSQPGFVSRRLLDFGEGRFADLVQWTSPQAAKDVMRDAPQHPACRAYFGLMQVDTAPLMGSLLEEYGVPTAEAMTQGLQPGGLEFSTFTPLPGVEDSQLAAAAAKLAAGLYQSVPGFHSHFVVKSATGQYADVLLADTAARARSLCESWGTGPYHPACLDYLALIDPQSVQLAFWQRLR